jgi:hypothetical protein
VDHAAVHQEAEEVDLQKQAVQGIRRRKRGF